jgi:hypothetical protein
VVAYLREVAEVLVQLVGRVLELLQEGRWDMRLGLLGVEVADCIFDQCFPLGAPMAVPGHM